MRKSIITMNFWPILLLAFLLGLFIAGIAGHKASEAKQPLAKQHKTHTYTLKK